MSEMEKEIDYVEIYYRNELEPVRIYSFKEKKVRVIITYE